ncbi:MAG: hypothetical protein JW810_11560, partial [Sedimentisphaerales bacterium]|nr:hypothetical protein [Sedimentisphaerales bacterium]
MNPRRLLPTTLLCLGMVWAVTTDGASGRLWAQNRPPSISETSHPTDSTYARLTGQRMMQTFDFEERRVHLDDLPMYWQQAPAAAGFPHYASGRLDSQRKRSGQYSFLLISDGGSVGFEYHPRRIAIRPGSDFQITGYVQMDQAPSCRARITCTLTDRKGNPIPSSQQASRLVPQQDESTDGWSRLEVYVPGSYPEARFLTIGIWLLQEEQWQKDLLVGSPIFRRDVNARAWFDDITIHQMPRVILGSNRPGNVFDGPQPAALAVEVEGISSLDYKVDLTVRNTNADLIHQEAWILTGLADRPKVREIRLPDLPAGLYHARLSIYSGSLLVATRDLSFARLAPLNGTPTLSGMNFGILALDRNIGDWDTVIALTRHCNAKLIKLPVWRRLPEETGAIFSTPNFDRILLQLQQNNIQVMAAFSEIPDALAAQLPPEQRSLLDLLSKDPDLWRPQLAFVLAQYARQVPYWQIGAEDRSQDMSWDPRIRSVVDTMHAEFAKLVSQTVLAVPLSSMFQVNQAQIGTSHVALAIPSAIVPREIPSYLEDSRSRGMDVIWANVEPLASRYYSRRHRIIDFAKRIAYTKKGGAQAIFTDHPWTQRAGNGRLVTEPTELFLVYRTLADLLGGTDCIGQFQLAPDIQALIFDRDGTGTLLLWNQNYNPEIHPEQANLEFYLGENPVRIDLFGNAAPLETQNGLARFSVTEWPVLINNVNTRLMHLRSTVRLEPAVVDASIHRQTVQLTFSNPFTGPISGRLRFLRMQQQQNNWLIDPVAYNFTLRPQETFSQPLTLKFPRNEVGGQKELAALFTIDADRTYRFIQSVPFEIRLAGVELSIFARRAGQNDLLIQKVVTNTSDEEMTLQSFIDLPDRDRLERAIPHLPPGVTVTKSFRIPNAAQ